MPETTEQEMAEWLERIPEMTHEQMARLYRFAPAGHPVFQQDTVLWALFETRWKNFGGFTPEISKRISG